MRDGRVLGIIPARLQSQRLPHKPLQLLAGRPLLEWVWRRVSSFDLFTTCVIATDAPEIAAACARFGAPVELTSAQHPSGTDRVAEVAARPEYRGYDVVVNVQGDEPFVTPEQVGAAIAQVQRGFDVGTVATPVRSAAAWRDPSVVKVVCGEDGGALYFSRAPIPHLREGEPEAAELSSPRYLRHVGIYAFTPAALQRWVSLPVHALEAIERLEQLRPLAAGLRIGVGLVAEAAGGVDTPADLARAEQRIRDGERTLQPSAES